MLKHINLRSTAVVTSLRCILLTPPHTLLSTFVSSRLLKHNRTAPIFVASKPLSIADIGKLSKGSKTRGKDTSSGSRKDTTVKDTDDGLTETVRVLRGSKLRNNSHMSTLIGQHANQHDESLRAPADGSNRVEGGGGKAPRLPCHDADQDTDCSVEERALQKAKNHAIRLLERRPFSVQVILEKLREKHALDVAEKAVARLQEVGLLSNAAYAEVYVRSKWNQKLQAPKLIKQDLMREGVHQTDIDAALEATFGPRLDIHPVDLLHPTAEEEAEESSNVAQWEELYGFENLNYRNWSRLMKACEMHLNASRRQPVETQKRRLANWLLRRGYTWPIINALCKAIVDVKA